MIRCKVIGAMAVPSRLGKPAELRPRRPQSREYAMGSRSGATAEGPDWPCAVKSRFVAAPTGAPDTRSRGVVPSGRGAMLPRESCSASRDLRPVLGSNPARPRVCGPRQLAGRLPSDVAPRVRDQLRSCRLDVNAVPNKGSLAREAQLSGASARTGRASHRSAHVQLGQRAIGPCPACEGLPSVGSGGPTRLRERVARPIGN